MIDTRIVEFEFDVDRYTYTARYSSTPEKEGWTVIRRKQGNPKIPPYMEVLTGQGWASIIQNIEQAMVFPTKDDVVGFAENGLKNGSDK